MNNICTLCPRNCKINRKISKGYCGERELTVSYYHLHQWEEPCISGKSGSGTIFFSGCNLKCIYCQNYEISKEHYGKIYTIEELATLFFKLKEMGALNINLVTPTHFVNQIKEAIILAKEKGFDLPFIYNTSGYEKVETIKSLKGLIDIYLPDFKYFDNTLANEYSKCSNYFEYTKDAIEEMYHQVRTPKFNRHRIIKKGLIIRHLILPSHKEDSKKILEYLYNKYQNNIYYSIMRQYTPTKNVKNHPILSKKVSEEEYQSVVNYAISLGIINGFLQDDESISDSFIPKFKKTVNKS